MKWLTRCFHPNSNP